MEYFLIDNGSLRPGSVIQMAKIARALSKSSGHKISPFGLMHSHKIDPLLLKDGKAHSMQEFLLSPESDNVEEIRALPFFLGPSLAITDWLPKNLNIWKNKDLHSRKFRILPPLYQPYEDRLSRAMAELCREKIAYESLTKPYVAMVDHGTPLAKVNEVREVVGEQMKKILDGQVAGFSTCAMERRPGPKYDFNNPLLENLLQEWYDKDVSEVVVSQFFLLPGRHAGPDGDLAKICQPFIEKGMKVFRTENLGAHPLVEQILLDRIRADLAA